MFILLFVAAPILLAVALAVRFAGPAKILNIVDYSRVRDPAALHAWAGNRLLALAVAAGLLGVAALQAPQFAIALVGVFVVLACGVLVWLSIGASRFQ